VYRHHTDIIQVLYVTGGVLSIKPDRDGMLSIKPDRDLFPTQSATSMSSPSSFSPLAAQPSFLSLQFSSLPLSSYLSRHLAKPLYDTSTMCQAPSKPSPALSHSLPFPLAHLSALRALSAQHQMADIQV
jgi:hypothetical protein